MGGNVDILVFALSKFVSIPSVSSSADHREDCRQAAIWLTKCFAQLGASSKTVCALVRLSHALGKLASNIDRIALRGSRGGTQPRCLCMVPGNADFPEETAHPLLWVRDADKQVYAIVPDKT